MALLSTITPLISLAVFTIIKVKKKIKNTKLFFFLLYLLSFVIAETIAYFISNRLKTNFIFYNLLTFFEFNLLLLFYKKNIVNIKVKQLINILIFIFNLSYILLSIRNGKFNIIDFYNNLSTSIGGLIIAMVLLMYFRELLISDKILNYKQEILFWITTGLFIYYIGTLPITTFVNQIKDIQVFNFLYKIQHILTYMMHFCFITGILWNYKRVI